MTVIGDLFDRDWNWLSLEILNDMTVETNLIEYACFKKAIKKKPVDNTDMRKVHGPYM